MKTFWITFLKILLWIAVIWGLLTLIAELPAGKKIFDFGVEDDRPRAMVFYDPDPFYNLDEQVCKGFAEGLAEEGWQVKILTVQAADNIEMEADLYVFCANTYNWAPDWAISRLINKMDLSKRSVAAITVGSGSTQRAMRLLDSKLRKQNADLLASETYWLMRPNDEGRMNESNVAVAVEMALQLAKKVSQQIL